MKDLFVLVADADMQAVFRALLGRPDALGIRPISFVVDRHPYRDPGVFGDGPELIRTKPKNEHSHFVVAFDHHGSGCKRPPDQCAKIIQDRLNAFTFTNRSVVVVIAPELEEWLWHDPSAILNSIEADTISGPKERLRQVFKRKPLPQDLERIAARADLQAWNSSRSFRILRETPQNWFPAR